MPKKMTGYALSSTKKEAEAKLKTALGLILFDGEEEEEEERRNENLKHFFPTATEGMRGTLVAASVCARPPKEGA